MFGPRPAPVKNWDDMYYYEKVQSVVDHSADFVVSKCRWWLPCVTTAVAASLFFLGGPEAPLHGFTLASTAMQPFLSPVIFQAPRGMHGEGPPEDDEDDY